MSEKIPIKVIIPVPFPNRSAKLKAGRATLNLFISMFVGLLFAGVFCAGVYIYASTYGIDALYPAGNTLNPTNCNPGDTYCKVEPSVSSTYVGLTSSVYSGSLSSGGLTGYAAGNAICNAETGIFTGSHMCSASEILYSVSQKLSSFPVSGSAWVNNGPPGYTANSNDCNGRTDATGNYLGAYWNFNKVNGGYGVLTACNGTLKVACCK